MGRIPTGKPVGRPAGIPNKDQKLSPKQERYVKARVSGHMAPYEAMVYAGYAFADNELKSTSISKANRFDRQPFLQARCAEIRAKESFEKAGKQLEGIIGAIESFDPENVTLPTINTGAMATFRAALNVDNFGQALSALRFMAETNNLVTPKRKAGRPEREQPPAEDAGGNYDFNTDDGDASEGAGVDSEFDAFGDGGGQVPAAQRADPSNLSPHTRKRDPLPEPEPEVDEDDGGFDEFAERDAGSAGEDGGEVS